MFNLHNYPSPNNLYFHHQLANNINIFHQYFRNEYIQDNNNNPMLCIIHCNHQSNVLKKLITFQNMDPYYQQKKHQNMNLYHMYFPIFLSIYIHYYQKVYNYNYPMILPPDQDHYKLYLKKYHIFLILHHYSLKNIFE